jgi:hypothetical protein
VRVMGRQLVQPDQDDKWHSMPLGCQCNQVHANRRQDATVGQDRMRPHKHLRPW